MNNNDDSTENTMATIPPPISTAKARPPKIQMQLEMVANYARLVLQQANRPVTPPELGDMIKISVSAAEQLLRTMAADGQIIQERQTEKYRNPDRKDDGYWPVFRFPRPDELAEVMAAAARGDRLRELAQRLSDRLGGVPVLIESGRVAVGQDDLEKALGVPS